MSVMDQVKFVSEESTALKVKAKNISKDPKIAPIINFLNGAVARSVPDSTAPKFTLRNNSKKITFKEFAKLNSDKQNKVKETVINLNNFTGIKEIKDAYELASKANAIVEKDEDKITADGITKIIYEPITRGYASMAERKFVEKVKHSKKESEEEFDEEDVVISDHLDKAISSLQLPNTRSYTIADFIKAIRDVVENVEIFKVKAFNKTFPLAVHNTDKESGTVNSRYVQHYLEHFDFIIQYLVEHIDEDDVEFTALNEVHKLLTQDFIKNHPSPNDELIRIQYATFISHRFEDHNEFIRLIKSYTQHKKGINDDLNEATIKNDIKAMATVVRTKKDQYKLETNKTIGDQKLEKDIFELITTLRKYLAFIDIILDGKKYLEDKNKSVINYEEIYDNYLSVCAEHEKFIKSHKDIPETIEGLVTYLAQSIAYISRFRGLDLKAKKLTWITVSEFNTDSIIFKLNVNLSKELKALYPKSDKEIAEGVHNIFKSEKFKNFANDLSIVGSIDTFKATPADNANILARIGEIANNIKDIQMNKNIRIAVGLAVLKYIIIETERILSYEHSKSTPLTIYIKY